MKYPISNPTQLVRLLEQHGSVILHGPQALVLARQAIEQTMKRTGFGITFHPDSAPELVDYLTIPTVSGLEGAIAGAGVGLLLGILFRQPAAGVALGAGLGGIAGVGRGVQRVREGWRVRAVREVDGSPVVTINAFLEA